MKSGLAVSLIVAATLVHFSPVLAAQRLVFQKPVYDFGTIVQGKTADHVFTFRNSSGTPVTIERISSSCGCTAATPSLRVIPPGKTGEIRASFNSSDFSGPVVKEVMVLTNEPQNQTYTLTIKGIVHEEIVITPRQLQFGAVKAGVRKEGSLRIENKGEKTVRITALKTAMPQVTISCRKKTLKPGESATIQISVVPVGGTRFLSGYLTIMTDSKENAEKTVPMYGILQ